MKEHSLHHKLEFHQKITTLANQIEFYMVSYHLPILFYLFQIKILEMYLNFTFLKFNRKITIFIYFEFN